MSTATYTPSPSVAAITLPGASPRIVGTPQQEAFWDAMLFTGNHLVLNALAGCGKSFSIVEAGKRALAKWPRLRVVYLAFNKSSAEDLRPKAPRSATVKTVHSLGNSAIIAHLGRRPDLNKEKTRQLLIEVMEPHEFKGRKPMKEIVRPVCELVSLCKSYLYEGTPEQIAELVERHDIELEPNKAAAVAKAETMGFSGRLSADAIEADAKIKARIYQLVPNILEASMNCVTTIDYDDQIWLPVVLDLPVEQFDLAFGDECQDWNLCQQRLVFKCCPKGRIVIVGDVNQSIYGFRGADSQSIPRMTAMLEESKRGVKVMPLTMTRRCPKSHVKRAQAIVPEFEAMPEAPEGTIEHIVTADLIQRAKPNEMVLCRTNAPLVKVAHQFLRAEKKAVLKGKDLSGPIKDLIEGLGAYTIEELGQKLDSYRMAESARLDAAGKSAQVITAHEDKCETVEVLCEGVKTLLELNNKIERIFNPPETKDAVLLMSVHGAKGLESDTIYILRPDLMPHPAALKKGRPDDIQQEDNCHYVALTRSKNRLVFVDDKAEVPAVSINNLFGEIEEIEPDFSFGDDLPDERLAAKLETDTTHYEPGTDPMCQHAKDWRDTAREGFKAVHDALPFDAPRELFEAIEIGLAYIPRK